MDISAGLTYVAALSVATERVTEFFKRVPGVSTYLSTKTTGIKEDIRVMCVHILSLLVGMVLCHYFPQLAPKEIGATPTLGWCFLFGLLASGGSSFWNSALDTFYGAKKKMGA